MTNHSLRRMCADEEFCACYFVPTEDERQKYCTKQCAKRVRNRNKKRRKAAASVTEIYVAFDIENTENVWDYFYGPRKAPLVGHFHIQDNTPHAFINEIANHLAGAMRWIDEAQPAYEQAFVAAVRDDTYNIACAIRKHYPDYNVNDFYRMVKYQGNYPKHN